MKRLRALLGTFVEIEVDGTSPRHEAAIDSAFTAIALVHRLMSVHEPGSDLSCVNRQAWRQPVAVHPWTAHTLRWAVRLHAATDGLFDCAVGHELGCRGLRPGCGFAESEPGTTADFAVSGDTVRLARRVALDLGGIAKGFAVDRAIAILRAHGVRTASVNAGGDLRVMGWPQPIHVRRIDGGVRLVGMLGNGAIATSGTETLIHVGDRTALRRNRLYSVVAPTCTVADALTKAVAHSERTNAPWLAAFGAVAFMTDAMAA